MGDFEHKPGSGSIFENGYKDNDRQPDYKGKIKDPTGKEWDISGWWKESRNGQFLSLAIQEPWQGRRSGGNDNSAPERPSGRPMTDEQFEAERRRRQQATGAASQPRGGQSGGGYGQTQRPPSARPGEVAGHSLPPMDDFADDDIPF